MSNFLPDIPRIYTALAESMSCFLYIILYFKNYKNKSGFLIPFFMGIGQIVLQYIAGMLSIEFWIIGMLVNLFWMFLTIYASTSLTLKFSIYTSFKAFVLAEFIASFVWQIYTFFILDNFVLSKITIGLIIVSAYSILLYIIYFIEKKYSFNEMVDTIETSENITLGLVTSIIFITSNLGFLLESTEYNLGNYFAIYIMRTLVNFNGISIILLLQIQKNDRFLKEEIDKINNVFSERQFQKYIAYKENNEAIKQKLHDLKHHVYLIKIEENMFKKNKEIDTVLEEIINLNANIETGNIVLDTILTSKNIYCIEQKIIFTCFVDGKLLNFMEVLDICNLFGNALDNAIEFVEQESELERRLINLKVCKKNNFVIIRFDNYCKKEPTFIDGLPVTTKNDTNNHGYGLKSIRFTTNKYNGNMTVSYGDNWFTLKILFPIV